MRIDAHTFPMTNKFQIFAQKLGRFLIKECPCDNIDTTVQSAVDEELSRPYCPIDFA